MALTKVSGSIIKDSVSLSGNVSVGGTLTYQDVTNVDALGIGTFRTGIKVLAGQVDIGSNIKLGNAGVVTATSFVGSGANLTGVTALSGSTNNTLVTVTGANAIQGESNLTFDGTTLTNENGSGAANLSLKATSNSFNSLILDSNRSADTQFAIIDGRWNGNVVSRIQFVTGSDGTNKDDGYMAFHTRESGASLTERLRIDPTGITTITSSSNEEIFRIQTSFGNGGSAQGKALMGFDHFSVSQKPAILIGSEEEGTSSYKGSFVVKLKDAAATDDDPVTRLRINSSGNVLIGTDSGSEILCIKRDDATGPTITLENNANKTYINNWGATGGGSGRTNRFEINATLASQASICAPYITFMIGNAGDSYEKLRIDSSGHLLPGNTDNSLNLGSSTARWANIYTGDLQLSNEGKTNVVDGTWGNYTIQEGESDLFLINNRSGKKYKFNLTEVV